MPQPEGDKLTPNTDATDDKAQAALRRLELEVAMRRLASEQGQRRQTGLPRVAAFAGIWLALLVLCLFVARANDGSGIARVALTLSLIILIAGPGVILLAFRKNR